jgi:hypothetical protein
MVTLDNNFYSFDPGTLTLTKIGPLDCPTASFPYDLTVGRDAVARVVMFDGTLFDVDPKTAHCTPTNYVYQGGGVGFGSVSFVLDPSTGQDVLYTSTRQFPIGGDAGTCSCAPLQIDGGPLLCYPIGQGLGRAAGSPLSITPIADYSDHLDREILALTGTGDGRLYGYYSGVDMMACLNGDFTPNGPQLVQIDPKTASVMSMIPVTNVLSNTTTANSYAFSFWGGDFWFYTATTGNSEITRYRASTDKSFDVVVADAGINIVGAGVSSCAPLQSTQ